LSYLTFFIYSGLGYNESDTGIPGVDRKLLDTELIQTYAHEQGARIVRDQPVVIALAVPKPVPVTVKGYSRNEDEIDIADLDVLP